MEPIGMDEVDREMQEMIEEGTLTESGELIHQDSLIYYDNDIDEDSLHQMRQENDAIVQELDKEFDSLVELRPASAHKGLEVVKAVLHSEPETEMSESRKGSGLRGKLSKVVLAYSGDLGTSIIVPWLRENYGCEVVCFTADVGQDSKELEGLEEKAISSGASQLVVKDLKEEFVRDYIFPCMRAGAVYERKYLLGTSIARPVIAKAMVDVAKEVGADAVSHGCTGKGNDQVQFELTFFALNPKLNIMAPWREWDITGREDAIEFAKKHNVPVPVTKKSIYRRDRNLWHLSHEGGILEDPANEPDMDMYMMSVDPEDTPDRAEYVEIGIESGLPVSVNGKRLSPATLLDELNEIGGRHGIGRVDMVENQFVGMKCCRVYETPGGTILFTAVRELEYLTLDREAIQVKDSLALKYAELVYAGRWFHPLRESIGEDHTDHNRHCDSEVVQRFCHCDG